MNAQITVAFISASASILIAAATFFLLNPKNVVLRFNNANRPVSVTTKILLTIDSR